MPGVAQGYFAEADPARVSAEYPVGVAFLEGPARLDQGALRVLQERRFLDTGLLLPIAAREAT